MTAVAIEARIKATQPTRRARAIVIRDAVLPWLREHGTDEVIEGCRVRTAEIGEFQFCCRTPFSGAPGPKKNAPHGYQRALLSQQRHFGLSYGLDVWTTGKKAMSIE